MKEVRTTDYVLIRWVNKLRIWKSSIASRDLLGLFAAVLLVAIIQTDHSATPKNPGKDKGQGNVASQPINPPAISKDKVISPSPLPTPPLPPPPKSSPGPSKVLNLTNWKLTLPVDTARPGSPDEIKQPALDTFTMSPYFQLNGALTGVIFRAHAGGATTGGSKYPRSELREMTNSGKDPASWSTVSGTHTMVIRQAITHLPAVKPDVVAGQIHDATDDVVMVRLEGKRLFIESDGKMIAELDTNYSLGTIFTVNITAAEGRIKVYYNNEEKLNYLKSGFGYYFKAGSYTQSNTVQGDSSEAYGEVIIYSLRISHS